MPPTRRPSARRRSAARPGARAGAELLDGRHVIAEALRAKRRELHRMWVRPGRLEPDVEALVASARQRGVPVEEAEPSALAERVGDRGFQGVLLEAGPIPELGRVDELAGLADRGPIVALDGVEDPRNLGAIARVADAAGAAGLLLTDRRAPPLSAAVSRASAGAIEWLPVCRVPNLNRGLASLKESGFWVVGADPDARQTVFEIEDRLLAGPLVVLLGAEGKGLRRSAREAIDHPVRIPMGGRIESLNVATAAAVILYEIRRRAASGEGPRGESANSVPGSVPGG